MRDVGGASALNFAGKWKIWMVWNVWEVAHTAQTCQQSKAVWWSVSVLLVSPPHLQSSDWLSFRPRVSSEKTVSCGSSRSEVIFNMTEGVFNSNRGNKEDKERRCPFTAFIALKWKQKLPKQRRFIHMKSFPHLCVCLQRVTSQSCGLCASVNEHQREFVLKQELIIGQFIEPQFDFYFLCVREEEKKAAVSLLHVNVISVIQMIHQNKDQNVSETLQRGLWLTSRTCSVWV